VNFHLSMPNPPLRDSERRPAPRSSALSVPALRAVVIPLELAAPKISALGVADRRTGQCFNHRVVEALRLKKLFPEPAPLLCGENVTFSGYPAA